MKFTYYANLIPGLQDAAGGLVKSRLKDAVIVKSLEGALIFQSSCPFDRLNLFCFNNIFILRDLFEGPVKGNVIEAHMTKIGRQKKLNLDPAETPGEKIRSFRVVCSHANQLVRVNENLKRNIESLIFRKTGLIPDRSKPGREYWFLYRSEGFSLFMERLTRHRSFDKTLHPGELTPQLAYLMCWMAALNKTHTALDPFCGYGSIPCQGLKHFPPEKFYALDIRDEALKICRSKFGGEPSKACIIKKMDLRRILSFLPGGSVDRIITDPPWGLFEDLKMPLGEFYEEMAAIFYRLLKDGGLIVLLTAGKDEFTAAVSKVRGLEILDITHVLVSGKKAGIFTVKKLL